jgi:hypothetical protein
VTAIRPFRSSTNNPQPILEMSFGDLLQVLTAGYGTSVWTGRALQVGYDGLEIVGLAHLYSAL